jgi:hypothetical protein
MSGPPELQSSGAPLWTIASGMTFLLLLAVLIALNAWVSAGDLAPVVESNTPDYIFLSPTLGHLTLCAVLSMLLLTVLHVAVARRTPDVVSWHNTFEWRRVSYLSPLLLLVLPLRPAASRPQPASPCFCVIGGDERPDHRRARPDHRSRSAKATAADRPHWHVRRW